MKRKTLKMGNLVALSNIAPSPENDSLYRPVCDDDPATIAMAESIRERGILEPLVISRDGFIVSGHRRFAAARLAGLHRVPVRVAPVTRGRDLEAFTTLLREHNRQRVKSLDELLREEVVSADPEEAYTALLAHRQQARFRDMAQNSAAVIDPGAVRTRSAISNRKQPMLEIVQRVITELGDYWPLSDRQIHYALLSHRLLRNTRRLDSWYANNRESYKDLCNLLTRARLCGLVPWKAITDETRPIIVHTRWANPQDFIRRELNDYLLRGYHRDYMRTQPAHIEIVGEKLTIRGIVEPVAARYGIPLTIGRGFSSIDPRKQLADRFRGSHKDKLIVLILSDCDPDGFGIAENFIRSLRDDFGLDERRMLGRRVALRAEQVLQMGLPLDMEAKTTSSRYKRYAQTHAQLMTPSGIVAAYELEAVPPKTLAMMLESEIETCINRNLLNAELAAEREDAAFLETTRRRVLRSMGS